MTLGESIKHFREKRGWSQKELGRLAFGGENDGAIQTKMSRIERDEQIPKTHELQAIAECLDVSIEREKDDKGKLSTILKEKTKASLSIHNSHVDIIERFKNKKVAKDINEVLLEIESLEETELYRILGYLQSEVDKIRRDKKTPQAATLDQKSLAENQE